MKAAVIGCGRMGAFTSEGVRKFAPASWLPLAHAAAIAEHPGLELAGLVDPSPEARARASKEYGVPAFSDHHAMLSEVAPLLVGIATRTPGRAALVEDCVNAGVRALHIEKPLCNSVVELDRLERVLGPGICVTLGAIRRHLSLYQRARALAWSGEYGAIREVRVSLGSGALYWAHPHSVDLLLWAMGNTPLKGVQARLHDVDVSGSIVSNDPLVAHASLWFEGGVGAHIGRATGLDLTFDCEGGAITVENDGRSLSLHAPHDDDPYPVRTLIDHPAPVYGEGALAAIRGLVAALDGDADAIAANELLKRNILTGQRVLFGMVHSHLEGGRIIELADIDPALEIRAVTLGNPA